MGRLSPHHLVVLASLACDPGVLPCDQDRTGCDDGVGLFALDSACQLNGVLAVEIGEGVEGYSALHDGRFPEIFHGPQGGTHVFLGFRLLNPALDRYDHVEVSFQVADAVAVAASRTVVLGVRAPLRVVPADATRGATPVVEEYGLLLQTSAPSNRAVTVSLTVKDPCGRSGTASVSVPAER